MRYRRLVGESRKDATTVAGSKRRKTTAARSKRFFALTVVFHRDARRIGQRALVEPNAELPLSRSAPTFAAPGQVDGKPLDNAHVSRKPIRIAVTQTGARVMRGESGSDVLVGDEPLGDAIDIDAAALEGGVVISIGDQVALLAHWLVIPSGSSAPPIVGVLGASSGVEKLRHQIHRVAPHDVPVLLQGETGTGKELAAAAIHQLSPRRLKSFVSVNLGAVPGSTAAAALFGHEKGAFTGATAASSGYFGQADGGTLFLDEVAEAPEEVQAALLRALESGEVQPIGATMPRRVDVRLIAATDADLDERMEEGRFQVPLMMRLSGYELRLPPLRERRDDIARLLVHFVREQLAAIGKAELLDDGDEGGWLPLSLVVDCVTHDWPGNVRQLRNVVRQWVIDYAEQPQIEPEARTLLNRAVTRSGSVASASASAVDTADAPRRHVDDIGEDELVAALERHRFRPGPAADELGIPRSSLYTLMEKSDRLRKATDLSAEVISAELDSASGDVTKAAATLRVSARGLRLRMKALGMT
jgi:two-component system nitrogen regulation response regulator GlnG